MRFVNVRELKSKTSEILRAAAGERIIVTSHGKPVAVVAGIDASIFKLAAGGSGASRVAETPASWGSPPPPEELRSRWPRIPSSEPQENPATVDSQLGSPFRPPVNPLRGVFWDYPELTNAPVLAAFIEKARPNPQGAEWSWVLTRMLERGRVVDVRKSFSWEEIRMALDHLRLSDWARAKWNRMLEVYDHA
jgi:prevent-host-death family protein